MSAQPAPSVFSENVDPVFELLTVDNGLPENSVRAMLQDRAGFLWLGTQNGLVRYDGYEMRVFLPSPGDSTAFGGRTIDALYEDSDGHIWVGTFLNGLWRYDPNRETFTGYSLVPEGSTELGRGRVHDVCEDANGKMWIALANGLAILDRDSGAVQWIHDRFPEGIDATKAEFSAVMSDASGRVWVGTGGNGVVVFGVGDIDPKHYERVADDPDGIVHSHIHDIYQASDGRIWLSTEEGLSRWNPADETFTSYQPQRGAGVVSENRLICLAEGAGGLLWIGSVAGVYVFDPDTGRFRLFAHDPQRPFSPANGPVLAIHCDQSGLVWSGAWYAGLNKMDPAGIGFRIDRHDPADPGSLDYNSVQAVYEDSKGGLWVATARQAREGVYGGLNYRSGPDQPFRRVSLDPESDTPYGTVRSFHEDPDGVFWVGTSRGLWRARDGRLAQAKLGSGPASNELTASFVSSMATDGQGNLWIGSTNNGLFRLRIKSGELTHFLHDPDDANSLSYNGVVDVYVDKVGRVWAGTDVGGLNLFVPDTGGFRSFFDPEFGLDSVIDICETDGGDLWLGTFAGLLLFRPDDGVKESYGLHHGLPNEQVVSILKADDDHLWISTGKGIARFDPATNKFVTFNERDGLPGNEPQFAHFKGSDGVLYFGGPNGLVTFRPGEFRGNDHVPTVVLTDITVDDAPLAVGGESPLQAPIHLSEKIVLRHNQNDISLTFAALDFGRPERNQYRFQLENFDAGWRGPGRQRSATYTNLSPGDYLFSVQGSNRDGVWNEAGASLHIKIRPPWWRTSWAYIIYALLLTTLGVVVYRQIVQRERMNAALAVEKAEAKHLHDLDRIKSKFLANISHEFRTPLTLIKTPLQRLVSDPAAGDRKLFATMSRNATRLGELIDQLLDISRLEAGRLPLKWQLSDYLIFLRALVSSFDSYVETRGIKLTSQIPEGAGEAWFDPDILEKVVGNLLSNALKFTPEGGEVEVGVEEQPEVVRLSVPRANQQAGEAVHKAARELTISVANTGSYIPSGERKRIFNRFHQLSSSGGSGLGLALVKELIEWVGGHIEVESDPDRGTRFAVTLPVFLEPPAKEYGTEAETAESLVPDDEEKVEDLAMAGEAAPLVLVVEDHPDLMTYLRGELPPEFRVVEAIRGDEGVNRAIEEIPDLVLSDVMMPGMDGFELCKRLKEDERTSHIPVILLTARTETESRREGLLTGADDYLAKPFDVDELKIRIHNLIVQRRKLAEQFARQVVALSPDAMPVSSADERFLLRAHEIIEAHLEDTDFKLVAFCREIGMSRAQLHRKLKAVTGQSTTEFIRTYRLQRAAQLLEGGYGNVTEVAYAVGFSNLSYFSKNFRALYGVQPSEYPRKS